MDTYARQKRWHDVKLRQRDEVRRRSAAAEMDECTFAPNLNKSKRSSNKNKVQPRYLQHFDEEDGKYTGKTGNPLLMAHRGRKDNREKRANAAGTASGSGEVSQRALAAVALLSQESLLDGSSNHGGTDGGGGADDINHSIDLLTSNSTQS